MKQTWSSQFGSTTFADAATALLEPRDQFMFRFKISLCNAE